jgi:HEAT repeat protein
LERQLTAPSAEQRVEALTALGKMREAAAVAEDAVIRATADPDIAVRLAAAHALGDIGATSQRAAWSLHAALGDSCLQVAASAQLSLCKLICALAYARAR